MLVQEVMESAGQRLLNDGRLEHLRAVDAWERLRLGIQVTSYSSARRKLCLLCGSDSTGLAHILAVCPGTQLSGSALLSAADVCWSSALRGAPAGDWPSVILSPQLEIDRLVLAVTYGAAVTHLLRAEQNNTKTKLMLVRGCVEFRWCPLGGNTSLQ